MKYLNTDKTIVLCNGSSVSKGHRLWVELGIDAAEAAGQIAPYVEEVPNKKGAAKATRDAAINSNIEVLGAIWDIDEISYGIMSKIVGSVDRNPQLEGQIRAWILADNTTRETTAADLRLVMDAHVQRMDDVYSQYGLWLNGDMSQEFEVVI